MEETLMEENENKFDNIGLLEVDDNAITLDFRVFVFFLLSVGLLFNEKMTTWRKNKEAKAWMHDILKEMSPFCCSYVLQLQ